MVIGVAGNLACVGFKSRILGIILFSRIWRSFGAGWVLKNSGGRSSPSPAILPQSHSSLVNPASVSAHSQPICFTLCGSAIGKLEGDLSEKPRTIGNALAVEEHLPRPFQARPLVLATSFRGVVC